MFMVHADRMSEFMNSKFNSRVKAAGGHTHLLFLFTGVSDITPAATAFCEFQTMLTIATNTSGAISDRNKLEIGFLMEMLKRVV